ncbi:MAG: gamma-glutamylcyclotransferase [Hyphomicrobium sp.]
MGGAPGDLWVFGYGSLMWRPDFPFEEVYPARLDGWHRRFCIVSRHYRGTDERPGLVLGLDRGGVCEGRVFRVGREDAASVLAYLRRREQISGVYREAHLPVTLLTPGRERPVALMFLAERAHPSFIRPLDLRFQAEIIRGAAGKTGTNLAYLVSTLEALRALGIREAELERLLVTLGPIRARAGSAGHLKLGHRKSMRRWPRRPVLRLADVKRFIHRGRMGGGK